MHDTLTIGESRQLMRVTQRLCRPPSPGGLLADQALADDLTRLFHADFLGSTHWNPERRAFDEARCVGRESDMARQFVERFQFEDPISPRSRLRREPSPIYSIVPRDELIRTSYYNEFLLPFKTVDGIDLYLFQGAHNVGDLRVWRAPGRKPLGEREVVLLRLLRPYLLGAMLGFRELGTADGDISSAAVEQCRWPCFSRRAGGPSARPANPSAEHLLRGLCDADTEELQGLVERVARTGRPALWEGFTLCAARDGNGAVSVVQLVPVLSATDTAHRLEQSYGLTPREAQICLLLVAGRADHQIATELNISYWTVRTHLRKVFIKFKVANRVELTRLLAATPG